MNDGNGRAHLFARDPRIGRAGLFFLRSLFEIQKCVFNPRYHHTVPSEKLSKLVVDGAVCLCMYYSVMRYFSVVQFACRATSSTRPSHGGSAVRSCRSGH